VNREDDAIERSDEAIQRAGKGLGDLCRVVAEDTTAPGAQHETAVLMGRGDRDDFARAGFEHAPDLAAGGRIA
jgi:hypothetical protein